MKRLAAWVLAPIDPIRYAVLRIAVSLVALHWLVTAWGYLDLLYSAHGVYPPAQAAIVEGGPPLAPALLGGDHVGRYMALALVTAALFMLGVATPVSGPLLYLLLLGFLKRNGWAAAGSLHLLLCVLLPLSLAPAGRCLSVDAWLRRSRPEGSAWAVPLRLIQMQTLVVYAFSAYYKLMSAGWTGGTVVLGTMLNPQWRRFDLDALLTSRVPSALLHGFDYGVVAFECLFPLILLPRLRPWIIVGGLALHGSQAVFIDTGPFAPMMLACYLAFLDGAAVRRLLRMPAPGPEE